MKFYFFFFFLLCTHFIYAQEATLFGVVRSEDDVRLAGCVLKLLNTDQYAVSNEKGEYELSIPVNKRLNLQATMIGFQPMLYTVELLNTQKKRLNIQMSFDENGIEDITVVGSEGSEQPSLYVVDKIALQQLPALSGGVETLIKTLPGVRSSNELSSQFNVRGGSFDENVVYINGMEVVRPQLIRTGQQEGLSIINSAMTNQIHFSAGGFEAQYGDKLSSVLSIDYGQPKGQVGNAYLGFMGAGLALKNRSVNEKFYYSTGGRFQSSKYLLNSLNEKGEYNPVSYDFQTVLGATLSNKVNLEVLGIFNKTNYQFEPSITNTSFGTYKDVLTFQANSKGGEDDSFKTNFVGTNLEYQINERFVARFNASVQQNDEAEEIDILSDYYLGKLENGEIDTVAQGLQTQNVNNQLKSRIISLMHQGVYETKSQNHYLVWGAGVKLFTIDDSTDELNQLARLNYTTGDRDVIQERKVLFFNQFKQEIYQGYLQDTWLPNGKTNLSLTGGIRFSHSNYTNETLVSPRVQLAYRPLWKHDVRFKGALGIYQQHPFYREFKNIDGVFNPNVKAQKSMHSILGSDYYFETKGRPFQFTTELFYKVYQNLVPYEYDVMRIRYLGNNLSTGYAAGLDMRLYGEFVEDAPSWLSLSLLKTEETVKGQGTVRRPTDQLVNASIFWQDYFSTNKNFKINLVGEFGGRLPVGIADGNRLNDDSLLPAYKRLDVGFSANLKGNTTAKLPYSPFESLKTIWLSAEVFNLFNIRNTSSYQWVFTPNDTVYSVPNYRTGRRLNAKLTITF